MNRRYNELISAGNATNATARQMEQLLWERVKILRTTGGIKTVWDIFPNLKVSTDDLDSLIENWSIELASKINEAQRAIEEPVNFDAALSSLATKMGYEMQYDGERWTKAWKDDYEFSCILPHCLMLDESVGGFSRMQKMTVRKAGKVIFHFERGWGDAVPNELVDMLEVDRFIAIFG